MTNFDNHIKEQLENNTPIVPSYIWENIVAERERRKPKGLWFTIFTTRKFFLTIAILLSIGTTAFFLFIKSSDKKSNPSDKNNKATTISTITPEKNTTINRSKPDNTTVTLNNVAAGAASVSLSQNTIYSPLPYLSANRKSTASTLPIAKNSSSPFIQRSTPPGIISGKMGNDGLNQDNSPLATASFAELSKLKFEVEKINAAIGNLSALKNKGIPGFYLPGCPSIEDDAAGNKKYLEIYGGPDLGLRSFSDTGNSTYLLRRKESAVFSSAFSAGVRYTKVFNNGMSIRTGVNYSQINEKFSLTQGNIVQVTYIINAQGDTTGSYTVTGTRYKTTYNRYRTLDVPLVAGYELGNGKLHANINAGAIINIYSWQKGDVLDAAGNPVSITTGKNASSPYGFKTNLGVGFTGAVSVYYKLTDKLHLMAEPYYRHNFSSMNKDNLTLKQKYNTAGLKIGIRLDLQK